MSAVELSLTDIMDKLVVDDWGQCRSGAVRRAARPRRRRQAQSEETLHAELGQIVAGLKPGRERDDETILFWHRGLSLSDIALGHAMLRRPRDSASASACATPDGAARRRPALDRPYPQQRRRVHSDAHHLPGVSRVSARCGGPSRTSFPGPALSPPGAPGQAAPPCGAEAPRR